jgi:hypothetical protein
MSALPNSVGRQHDDAPQERRCVAVAMNAGDAAGIGGVALSPLAAHSLLLANGSPFDLCRQMPA